MTDKQLKKNMLGMNPFKDEVIPIEINIGNHTIRHLVSENSINDINSNRVKLSDALHKIIDYEKSGINDIDIAEESVTYESIGTYWLFGGKKDLI